MEMKHKSGILSPVAPALPIKSIGIGEPGSGVWIGILSTP